MQVGLDVVVSLLGSDRSRPEWTARILVMKSWSNIHMNLVLLCCTEMKYAVEEEREINDDSATE